MSDIDVLDKRALYLQVKELIRERVRRGEFPPDRRLPTNRQLGRMMNVSTLTVQRALAALAEEGLLYARRGKGTFVRGQDTGSSERKKTGLYACLVPTIQSNTVAATVHAIDTMLFDHSGQHVVVCNSENNLEREVRLLDSLLGRSVDALIYQSNPQSYRRPIFINAIDVRLQKFLASGVPVVMLDEFAKPLRYDTILPNERRTCELSIRHLLELGHRRILYIAHEAFFKEKTTAFCQTARDAGLSESEVRVQLRSGMENTEVLAAQAMERVLADGWPFTAIVAATDHFALGAYRFLKERGIHCPGDVSIVGADNLQFVENVEVPLTTVWCEPREVAQEVHKLLESRRMQSDLRQASPARVEVMPEMVVRKTTGRPLLQF